MSWNDAAACGRSAGRALPTEARWGSSQLTVWSGSEPAGLEEAAGDVVGEIAETEGGAAEMLKAAAMLPDSIGASSVRACQVSGAGV